MGPQPIPRDEWAGFFRSLCNRHIGDLTRLKMGPPARAHQESGELILLDYDPDADRLVVEIEAAGEPVTRALEHPSWVVANVVAGPEGNDSLRINGLDEPERFEILFGG